MAPVSSRFCSKGKYLKCNECNKTFNSKIGLDLHVQHHTGQYSYFCGQCRKGFVTLSNYKLHMRGHEGKGYPCEYCGKVFKSPTVQTVPTNLNILEITGSLAKLVAKDLIEKGFILNILLHTNSLAFVPAVL